MAVEAREPGNRAASVEASELEPRAVVDDRLDDRADLVDLAPVAGDGVQERLVAAPRIVVDVRDAGRELVDRRRKVGEKAADARERLGFRRDLVVHRSVARVDRAPAEGLLVDVLSEARDDGRPGDEQLRGSLYHQAVVAGDDAGRAEAGDGTETTRDHGYRRQVRDDVLPARIERYERSPFGLERLHRAAAARSVDQPHDRHPQVVRHTFGVYLLLEDRRVGCAPAHSEVVAADNHRPPVDTTTSHDEVRGRHVDEVAVVVVGRASGKRTDLVEGPGVEQRVDPLPNRELPLRAVARDLLRAPHASREIVAPRQLRELRFPTHLSVPRHSGRLPVAAAVLPLSRNADIARSAVHMRWISSAPSAKRAQRACRNMSASDVSLE